MPAQKTDITARTRELLSGSPNGAYILLGKEEFLKTRFIRDITDKYITDDLCRAFDYTVTDGDVTEVELFTVLDSPAQFAEKRLVILKGFSPERNARQNREFVLAAAKKAALCENLCFLASFYDEELPAAAPETKSFITALSKTAEILQFDPLPKSKLAKWTRRHFTDAGIGITDEAVLLLAENTACDMTSIRNEAEKLCAWASENKLPEITEKDVHAVVCKTDAFDSFYVSNALAARDFDKLYAYVKDAQKKKTEPVLLLAMFSREAEKLLRLSLARQSGMGTADAAKALSMHEYPVRLKYELLSLLSEEAPQKIANACYRADLQLKSGGGGYGLITALVAELACLMRAKG